MTSQEKTNLLRVKKKNSAGTSHSWKKLAYRTNFAEPVITSFLGFMANIGGFKIFCRETSRVS